MFLLFEVQRFEAKACKLMVSLANDQKEWAFGHPISMQQHICPMSCFALEFNIMQSLPAMKCTVNQTKWQHLERKEC